MFGNNTQTNIYIYIDGSSSIDLLSFQYNILGKFNVKKMYCFYHLSEKASIHNLHDSYTVHKSLRLKKIYLKYNCAIFFNSLISIFLFFYYLLFSRYLHIGDKYCFSF